MIEKNLPSEDICRLIMDAQEIIANLTGQNKVTNTEAYHLNNAFMELQKAFESQFNNLYK